MQDAPAMWCLGKLSERPRLWAQATSSVLFEVENEDRQPQVPGYPSITMNCPVAAPALNFLTSEYSSDWKNFFALSRLGNSMTTTRRVSSGPSSVTISPPRTMNLPPKCSMAAGVALVYSQ